MHLSRWFRATGLDTSPRLLAIARRELPEARLVRWRMQTFRRPGRFDVITCLFSAIGHVRDEAELVRTLGTSPVLPDPEEWRSSNPGSPRRTSVSGMWDSEAPGSPIVRLHASRWRGRRSHLDMHHLAATDGRVRRWVERHDMALFNAQTIRQAFRTAGFAVPRVKSGFSTQRGLYLGIRKGVGAPASPPRGDRRRREPVGRWPIRGAGAPGPARVELSRARRASRPAP